MNGLRLDEAEVKNVDERSDEDRASERGIAAAAHGIDLCQLDASEKVKTVMAAPIAEAEVEMTDEELAEKAARAALNGF